MHQSHKSCRHQLTGSCNSNQGCVCGFASARSSKCTGQHTATEAQNVTTGHLLWAHKADDNFCSQGSLAVLLAALVVLRDIYQTLQNKLFILKLLKILRSLEGEVRFSNRAALESTGHKECHSNNNCHISSSESLSPYKLNYSEMEKMNS